MVLGENIPTSFAQTQDAATVIVNTLLISTNICETDYDIGESAMLTAIARRETAVRFDAVTLTGRPECSNVWCGVGRSTWCEKKASSIPFLG